MFEKSDKILKVPNRGNVWQANQEHKTIAEDRVFHFLTK